ncbi:MAG: hypothetical protein RI571_07340 [Roseovarius sp.]|jgi:hypothetical protein|nr:hypothetical protein [Roseovarius sp.]
MDDLRGLIRQILTEELAELRGESPAPRPQIREETVTLRSNADLQAFVQRILSLAQDGKARAEIEAGRHVFRLGAEPAPRMDAHQPAVTSPAAPPAAVRFDRGLVGEREVAALPDTQKSIRAAKSVRFTPLARDELRRRGIKIERDKT